MVLVEGWKDRFLGTPAAKESHSNGKSRRFLKPNLQLSGLELGKTMFPPGSNHLAWRY